MANRVPPDATADEGISNDQRASWAYSALLTFAQTTGSGSDLMGTAEERALVVTDLLADLAHWCDRNDVDLQLVIQRATDHYQTETASEGKQLVRMVGV